MVLRAFKGAFNLNAAIGKSLRYLIRVGEEFAGTVISESTIYCSLLSISISIGAARFDPAYPAMVHLYSYNLNRFVGKVYRFASLNSVRGNGKRYLSRSLNSDPGTRNRQNLSVLIFRPRGGVAI